MAQHENMMVDGHVRLVRQLGQGGMGTLWVGYDNRLDRNVAVKFITPEVLEKSPGLKERFKREAVAAARIQSPYVVQIHAHGEQDDGTPFMVMELLEGESLGERLARAGRLTLEQNAEVFGQVCKALTAAHKLGVVHRDIKPDNIFLLNEDLFVKLLDFGIAKHSTLPESASNLTATGSVLGTPHYMSPEQLLNTKGVDHRADLWALGVVGYIMLTGELPFVGDTLAATIVAITSFSYAAPSTRGAPAAFDAWFAKAFHRNLDYRFADAKQMAVDFAAACRRQADVAPSPALTRPGHPYDVAVTSAPTTVPTPPQQATPAPFTPAPPQGYQAQPTPNVATTMPSQPPGAIDPRGGITPAHGGMRMPTPPHVATTISSPPGAIQGALSGVPQTFAGSSNTLSTEKKTSVAKVLGILLAAGVAGGGVVGAYLLLRAKPADETEAARASAGASKSSEPQASAEPAPPPAEPPSGMVAVPAGTYNIGCASGKDAGCFDDESPRHEVALPSFAIMTHEVTMGDYDVCVGEKKCPPAGTDDHCTWQRDGHEKHPINCVTFDAAKAYCSAKGWRLPTEQEWEAAARPPDSSQRYPWGDTPPSCDVTVLKTKKPGCGTGDVVTVGAREHDKSHVGAFDMGGNVREWTSSTYAAYPGGTADGERSGIVNRGGSYLMNAKKLSSVYTRGVDGAKESRPGLGFRCAVDL